MHLLRNEDYYSPPDTSVLVLYMQMIFQHRINITCYNTCALLPKNSENACMERIGDGNPRTLRGIHTTPTKTFQESVISDSMQLEKQSD